jgi:hypothetical protein
LPTKTPKGDEVPAQTTPVPKVCLNPSASPIEKQSGQGLLTSLKGAGLEADPSGGWTLEKPIHDEVDLMEIGAKVKFLQAKLVETAQAVCWQGSPTKEFDEIQLEIANLVGAPAAKRIAERELRRGKLVIEAARLQRSTAKGGEEIVIEKALEKTQPSQGHGGKASPGNKRAKGAKTPPLEQNKGKGRKS